jgi:23S rRNA pseudouridine2605 synthase
MSDDIDTVSLRLNKYLALNIGMSRREADDLIHSGQVTINDKVAILGARVEEGNEIRVGGKIIAPNTKFVYLALNKPTNYVCSRKQQGDSPTIYDLLPEKFHALKTVGRLDRDSSGIILLTNNGDFAQQMTHPSYGKVKQYEVSLDRPLEPLHQQMISDFGVDLPDGKSQLTLEGQTDDRRNWKITMYEGRNRQIRRTFTAVGYEVTDLHRTDFGPYHLGNLKEGKFEIITLK